MIKLILSHLVLFFGLMFFAGTASSDQNDDRLDHLFIELAKADQSLPDYKKFENEIWMIWGQASEDSIQNLMDLGYQSLQIGLFDAALTHYTRVTELAPDFAEGWNKQATVLYLMDRYSDSLLAVNHTLKLEPRHFGALSGLGLIYEIYGEENGAKAAYKKALSYNPHLERIQTRLEYLQSLSGDAEI